MSELEPITGDVQMVRQINRKAALALIRQHTPISRTALARLLHLTPATAFSIVEELLQTGLVMERGIGASQGGRRPMLFEFNPRSRAVIGVAVHTTQVLGVLVYLDASRALTVSRDYQPQSGTDVVQLIAEVIRELIARAPVPFDQILGIGVAMPGLVDIEKGVVIESRNWGWQELSVRSILAQQFSLPLYIEEDDNAVALAEASFGAGRGVPNVVVINTGGGLGSGLIINGSLVRGPDNTAGEIQHILVDPDGPQCYCGNYGCLVRLASAEAVRQRAIKGLKQGAVSSLRGRVGGELERVTMALITEAAASNDTYACRIMEEMGRYLGMGIAILVNLLNPDLVIISGEVTAAADHLLEPIRNVVSLRALSVPGRRVRIVAGKLGIEAAAIGAATHVMIQERVPPS